MAARSVAAMVLLAASAFARTDIAGCTYYDTVVHATPAYATRIWYVPDSGEVCSILDCGGGRAPPKTTVPGCPAYSGTATYEPSFINPKTLGGQHVVSTTSTSVVVAPTKTDAAVTTVLMTAAPADAGAPNTSSSTGVAPNVSTTVSPSQGSSNGTNTAIKTTVPTAGAVPTAAAVLGSCLIAGVAACLGMM